MGAMCKVWASNYSREALLYCAQVASPVPRMAVVLQPMEPLTARDRSGVAFSHSPAPSMPGVLIQASFGSGQVVVGGRGGDLYGVQGKKAGAAHAARSDPGHARKVTPCPRALPGLPRRKRKPGSWQPRLLRCPEVGQPGKRRVRVAGRAKPSSVQVRSVATTK